MKQIILTILAVVCLCVAFLSAGITLCVYYPPITENLSRATATVDTSHFVRDQLVAIADKTRGFVAGTVDKNEIYAAIEQINKEANTKFKDLEGSDFAAVSDEYTLDSNAISHLEDVKSFFANIKIALYICAISALVFCILLLVLCGRGAMGRALFWSGFLVLITVVALSVWAVVDFNSMFNWLHSLFFKNGSWLFSGKSLLISMYPTAFWVGMGVISGGVSIALAVISMIAGKVVK